MNGNFEITYFDKTPKEYDKIISDSFANDARVLRGIETTKESFAFVCTDCHKNFIGSVNGDILYGSMHISRLFVSESFRKLNYGRLLMQKAEEFAQKRNCRFVTLNTFDWQAREFYEKLGYQLEFTRTGYVNNTERYALKKDL